MAGSSTERFAALVVARRYDLALQTLRIVLAHGLDSTAKRMLRAACGDCLRSFGGAVEEKLELLDFFQCCFELAGDIEEQFVLRYEELMLRETFSVEYPQLVVTAEEWIEFARDCSKKNFFSNAVKAYDMAMKHTTSTEAKQQATAERESAFTSARGTSVVQVEGLGVLKRKESSKPRPATAAGKTETSSGAAQYLSAIKRLNLQRLKDYGSSQTENKHGNRNSRCQAGASSRTDGRTGTVHITTSVQSKRDTIMCPGNPPLRDYRSPRSIQYPI